MTDSLHRKTGRSRGREMAWLSIRHWVLTMLSGRVEARVLCVAFRTDAQNSSAELTHLRKLPFCHDKETEGSRSCAPAVDATTWKWGSPSHTWFQDCTAPAARWMAGIPSATLRKHLDSEIFIWTQEEPNQTSTQNRTPKLHQSR